MLAIIHTVLNGLANIYVVLTILFQKRKVVTKKRSLDGKEFSMAKTQTPFGPFFPVLPVSPAPKINPSRVVLKKGTTKEPGMKALESDMIFETDVKIRLRDGVHVYADVYRPTAEDTKCPAILVWSPYGKHLNMDTMLATMPGRVGLDKSECSGYEDFEGPDPAFFVPRGYAVVNVDIRGSWRSEGDLYFWGKQEQVDGYDVIEYLASLPWCNGKIGMSGNSWLAISQWFIAAGNPPHLAAIAPWEGMSDGYRDQHRRGGIPSRAMPSALGLLVPSIGLMEEAGYMAVSNPLWNEYWEDKKVDLANITVPAYVVGSYSSRVHVSGSFRGFRNISSPEKWFRVHPHQEWHDLIRQQSDLARFFDYYLKGIQNDWPSTPTVRCSLLRMNGPAIENKPMDSYPPSNGERRRYYLDASSCIATETSPKVASTCQYRADGTGQVHFDITFNSPSTLVGFPSVRLYMHCDDHDDMDVFVILRKLDRKGVVVEHINYPTSVPPNTIPKVNTAFHQGPTGVLRASHRRIQPSNECAPGEIFHPHLEEEKVKPGTIVPLEFSTWPIGVVYEAGESLRLSISGRDMCYVESDALPAEKNYNRGSHVIHTGGEYQSWITLPFINLA